MHPKAMEYDKAHGKVTHFGAPVQIPYNHPPVGRPCDHCGEPVMYEGYIHKECLEISNREWLDILY